MTNPKVAKVWDKSWKYTRSEATDLDALFKRIRKQLKEAEKPQPANVRPLRTKGAA